MLAHPRLHLHPRRERYRPAVPRNRREHPVTARAPVSTVEATATEAIAAMAAIELAPGASLGQGGRYRLERVLGTGGMASVWLARDVELDREVAAKVLADVLALDPDYVSRFEREARVAANLSHPHLVRVFDFSGDAPRPYL